MANLLKARDSTDESKQTPKTAGMDVNHSQQPPVEVPTPKPVKVAPVQPKAAGTSGVKPRGAQEEAKKPPVQVTVPPLQNSAPSRLSFATRTVSSKAPFGNTPSFRPPVAQSRPFKAIPREDSRYATTSSIVGLPRRALESTASQPPAARSFQRPRPAIPQPAMRIEPPRVSVPSPSIPKIIPLQAEVPNPLPTVSVQRVEQESFQKARDQLRAQRADELDQPPPKMAKVSRSFGSAGVLFNCSF